jgi:hypothetical protein
MNFLSPRIHGILDYLTSGMFALAPLLLRAEGSEVAVLACYVVAGTLLVVSLLTRYPLGAVRLIPFPVHGGIELVTSVGLVALPWLGGFADLPMSRWFFLGAGLSLFTLWCITDYRGAE